MLLEVRDEESCIRLSKVSVIGASRAFIKCSVCLWVL
jgi:hypothetical protein